MLAADASPARRCGCAHARSLADKPPQPSFVSRCRVPGLERGGPGETSGGASAEGTSARRNRRAAPPDSRPAIALAAASASVSSGSLLEPIASLRCSGRGIANAGPRQKSEASPRRREQGWTWAHQVAHRRPRAPPFCAQARMAMVPQPARQHWTVCSFVLVREP